MPKFEYVQFRNVEAVSAFTNGDVVAYFPAGLNSFNLPSFSVWMVPGSAEEA